MKIGTPKQIRRRLLATSPDHVATRRELALQILARDPRDRHTWGLLANALADLSDFRGARHALRRVAVLATDADGRYWVHVVTGNCFKRSGQLEAAERSYRKAAAISPLGYVLLGAALAKQGKFAEAKRSHRLASESPELTGDDRSEAFYNIGLILRAERRYKQALAAFEKALELDPRYVIAREDRDDVRAAMRVVVPKQCRQHWRLLMRTMRSQPAAAHEVARAYVRRYPKHFAGWLALADVLANFARYREAFAGVEKASELAAREHWAESPRGAFLAQWGHVRLAQMDFARAESCYRKAVRLPGPRAHVYRVWLAESLVAQGRFAEATRLLRKSPSARPSDSSLAYYLLGLIARSRRQYREAIKYFDRALAIDRSYRSARVARRDALKAMTVRSTNPTQ